MCNGYTSKLDDLVKSRDFQCWKACFWHWGPLFSIMFCRKGTINRKVSTGKPSTGKCSTPSPLLICSSFSKENCNLLLICSSLSTSQSNISVEARLLPLRRSREGSCQRWEIDPPEDSKDLGSGDNWQKEKGSWWKKQIYISDFATKYITCI